MFNHWNDNPIYARLAKKDSAFVKPVFWIAGIAGVAGLIISAWHLYGVIANNATLSAGVLLTAFVAWLLMASAPVAVALTAATLTGSDIDSEAYQLVKITGLSRRTIARGYLFAAFRRRRLLLTLTVALVPTAIVGMLASLLSTAYSQPYSNPAPPSIDIVLPDVTRTVTILSAYAIGFLALTIILGALSVGLALWWKKQAATVAVSATLSIVVVLVAILSILTLIGGPVASGTLYSELTSAPTEIWISVGACALLPTTLAGLSLWLIRMDNTTTTNQTGADHVQTLDG
ncbi:MAG: hypothetical protein JXJ17_05725 [Anaerolineae bacterium]|nr:hypothetical protein [Anaerolineae bacterium]